MEDPQTDIPLQRASESHDWLIAQSEPVSLLVGDDPGLLDGIDFRVEQNLGRVARTERGIHHSLELPVILGKRLKLVDGGVETTVVLVACLHLVGDRPEVRLKIRDGLTGTDKFVDFPAEEGGQPDDLVGLGPSVPLFDGDVGGAAASKEFSDLLLRLATSLAGIGDPLAQNSWIDFMREHG